MPRGFDFVKFPFARKRDWASSGQHLNRFGPPALQLYKHLSNGEGGSVPGGGVPLLRDPEPEPEPEPEPDPDPEPEPDLDHDTDSLA